MTRAINRLFIVTTSSDEITPFLDNISIDKINWSDFPSIKTHQYNLTIRIQGKKGKGSSQTFNIKEPLKTNNYIFDSNLKCWEKGFSVNSLISFIISSLFNTLN